MSRDDALRVYLRLASGRTTLDSPVVRFGTLAQVALELAGARVLPSSEAGRPGKPRDDAFSWTIEHDQLLRGLRDGTDALPSATGDGIVVSDDVRTVAQTGLPGLPSAVPVLWAAPASCLLDPPAIPPAALTLTDADAHVLRDAGVRAVSLLSWPRSPIVPAAPRRVVIAVAGDADDLQKHLDAVRESLPGRPVIEIVPDAPVWLDGVRHAPLHPWRRSRAIGSAELVIVLGRSASTDLVAAEAAMKSIACVRATPASAPIPADSDDSDALRLALPALAPWLVAVSELPTDPGSKES